MLTQVLRRPQHCRAGRSPQGTSGMLAARSGSSTSSNEAPGATLAGKGACAAVTLALLCLEEDVANLLLTAHWPELMTQPHLPKRGWDTRDSMPCPGTFLSLLQYPSPQVPISCELKTLSCSSYVNKKEKVHILLYSLISLLISFPIPQLRLPARPQTAQVALPSSGIVQSVAPLFRNAVAYTCQNRKHPS